MVTACSYHKKSIWKTHFQRVVCRVRGLCNLTSTRIFIPIIKETNENAIITDNVLLISIYVNMFYF